MTPSSAEAAELAEELRAIRRRVVNVVGHELRTPVTTVHGLAQEVAAATDLTTIREVLGPALLRNTARLSRLLDDLLMATGIDTAVPVDQPGQLDVPELLRTVWGQEVDHTLAGWGEIAITGDPATIQGPLEGLGRALRAVLENAAAYGTGPPTVTVTDGARVVIEVRSPAPPIHPEEVRLALEPFFRGERAVTTCAGLGMGLAIARAVADRAGGAVSFHAVSDGTVTRVELPKRPRTT